MGKSLGHVFYKTRISRLEALQIQIQQQVEMLAGSQQKGMKQLLGDIYGDTYYRTIYEIQKGTGLGASFARIDPNRQVYYVSADMSYGDWYQKYVVDNYGQEQADIMKKKITNESGDKKQYERYKEVLGKDAPKSFVAFQDLKYTDSEGWNKAKGNYRKLNAYEKIAANEPMITADLQEISRNTGVEMVGLEYRLKSKESYLRKVNSDSKNSLDSNIINDTIASTNDVIRYTYLAVGDKLVDAFNAVISQMESKGFSKFKLKNTWNDRRNPYKGINAIFVNPDGQKFEVQFHTPESFELKNGELHKLYEEYRLDNTTPERRVELIKEMFVLSSKLARPKDIEKIK